MPGSAGPPTGAPSDAGTIEDGALVVPVADRGSHALARSTMDLPDPSVPFTAARELGIVSLTKESQPDPDIARHASVFATATAAAAELHARLVVNARAIAADARQSAGLRADRRQRDLDRDLTRLTSGLEEAQSALNSAAVSAVTLLDQHEAVARSAIRAAAGKALGAAKATHDKVSAAKTKQQDSATKVDNDAAAAVLAIKDAGTAAETSLHRLSTSPEETFGKSGGPMRSAQNERIALRIPPRATAQEQVMHKAAEAQNKAIEPMVTQLRNDLTAAFAVFDLWLADLETKAPEAVKQAETSALDQLRASTRRMAQAIETGRLQAETALIGQHNMARRQLIDSADKRARQEDDLAAQRATADVSNAVNLAGSPASTVEAVRGSLQRERRRPADEFAKIVIRSALSMTPRLDGVVGPQQRRLNQRARDALTQLDGQSDETSGRLYSSVLETVDRLIDAAMQTGQAMEAQADGAGPGLTRLARPVAQSTGKMVADVDTRFAGALDKLSSDIKAAGGHLTASLAGTASGKGKGEAAEPVTTPGPSETPNAFKARADGITAEPETEQILAAFVTTARAKVQTDIENRASGINTELGSFFHTEENIFANLRQMLPRQARALTFWFNTNYRPTLSGRLKFYFDSSVTTNETWRRNSRAAAAYLAGNASEGALQELAASVVLWNDTARLERVQRSLTPAQMMELQTLRDAPSILADVRGDIDGVDLSVFNALNAVTESDASGVGRANALRLTASIDSARRTRGHAGGEATYNAIRDANRSAGSNLLSGADALDLDTDAERRDRRERAWTQTLDAFAVLHPLPETYTGPRDSREALIAFASGERTYVETHGHGEHAHSEIVRERVGADHERLIGNLVRTGEGSPETRAALMVVQMRRPGARPDVDRFDEATYDADLNPDLASTDPERFARRDRARERRREMFRLYDRYMRGEAAVADDPRSPEAIQADLARTVGTRLASDENRAAYVRGMITHERGDPVAAFTFAVNDWGTNTEVLRRTFGRMTREQVDRAVHNYALANNGESLYARLGIHGEGSWLTSELSGEERQQITVASMGVAQNDLQRAEVAAMEARLQRNEAGWAGRWLAGEEYARLARDYQTLLGTMGVSDTDREGAGRTDFDRLGRLTVRAPDGTAIPVGHFTAEGRFEPPAGMPPEALEIAIGRSGISQRAYVAATDRIANAITTTLVVTAAIVTTALTGGAAASIWIPVLVTAGAGLAGIAASAAIKGGRYGHEEMLRDLGMTIVQAATAGLGAAAGVALRGGAPALRAVGSRMMVSEKALERFMSLGGRGGLRGALTMGEEALIAGGTSAFGGMGQAALDPEAWRSDRWGEGILHAGFRGMLGGALGSALMRPVMRVGLPEGTRESLGRHVTRRGLGSAVSGTTSRAVELGYDYGRGHRLDPGQIETELQMAFLQNLVQGLGEGAAERGSDRIRDMRAEARRTAARRTPAEPGAPAEPAARAAAAEPPARPIPEPEAPPVTRPEAEAEPAAPRRPAPENEPPRARPAAPPEAEPVPVPPALRETVPEIADAVAGPLRPVAEEMRVAAAEVPPDTAVPPAQRPPAAPEEVPRVPRVANDNEPDVDEPTQRFRRPDGAEAEPARRPANPDEIVEFDTLPDMTVMMDPDPRSHTAANDNYEILIRADPSREAAVYFNPETGEYIVVQGNQTLAAVGRNAAGDFEAPMHAGIDQPWKALLDHDIGRWTLLAHYHPSDPATGQAGLSRRLPSGAGRDLSTVEYESAMAGGTPASSRIHFLNKGAFDYTDFGFDPTSTTARYWIDYPDPVTGRRERREFASIEAYGEFVEFATGIPKDRITTPPETSAPAARPTAARPPPLPPASSAEGPSPSPRPGDLTLLHGTTDVDVRSMLAEGIQLGRLTHDDQDFGRAFYLTFDQANANEYGDSRSASRNRVARDRGQDAPSAAAAVLEFRLNIQDLGTIVDVRPGGPHRAAWEEFLNRRPPAFPRPHPLVAHIEMPWQTTLEYIMTAGWGLKQRGVAFDAFLQEIGMAHADAVWGDLGGDGTSGIAAAGGGEQLAIRNQAIVDRLTEQLRAAMGEAAPEPVRPAVPRSLEDQDEPPGGPPPAREREEGEPAAPRATEEPVPPRPAGEAGEPAAPAPRPGAEEEGEPAPARPATEEAEAQGAPARVADTPEAAAEPAPAARGTRRKASRMRAADEAPAEPRAAARAKPTPKAKAAPKKKAAGRKAAGKKEAVKKEAGKKAAGKKAAPRKAAPKKAAPRKRATTPRAEEPAQEPVRRDLPIEPTREAIEGAVLRNLAELQRIVQDAAQQALSDPEVVAGVERARAREAATIEARNAARTLRDSEIPQMLLEVGAGFLAAAMLIRQTALPTGMTGDNSVLFTRFIIGLALGNERQFVRGPGGRFLGQGRIPGQTQDRRLNYDVLVAELRHYRGADGQPLGGREFVGILRDFAQTGMARPPFDGAEGAAALGEFARLIFSVEVARSTNFAVEGAQILHLMETTNLSLEDAFLRSSALNPMSMRKAVAANRRYEESVAGDPAAHAELMRRTMRDVARKRSAGDELTAFEQVVTRRQELLVQSIMAELAQQRQTFANDEAFLTWVREELRRRLLERTRRLFNIGQTAAPRTYPGLFGPLPVGQG